MIFGKNNRKHRRKYEDPVEKRFDTVMELVKDLPRSDYNRLKCAMDLGYDAYQKIRNVKTVEEREADIDEVNLIEKALSREG